MRGTPPYPTKQRGLNMIKTVTFGDKTVKLKASAATPRLYRDMLDRDIFTDFDKLLDLEAVSDSERWSIFENMAFVMAKQADNTLPDDISEWLDSFDGVPAITNITSDIIDLWLGNTKTHSEAKKKAD